MEYDIFMNATAPKYRQLSRIARGSFGTVYRVKLRGRDRPTIYALKKIKIGPGTEDTGRREIISLSSLPTHKNVVSLIDHYIEDGMLNVVMELCDIGNLNSYMCFYGADDGLLRSFMKDMMEGLAHLHKHGIVHGDIKPDNILLCSQINSYPKCKFADFGLSRFNGDGDTFHLNYLNENRGSHYFAAPEVLKQGIVSQKSDVFSLGVVFYAMHTREGFTNGQGILAPTVDGFTVFWKSNNRYIEERISRQVKDTVRSGMLVAMTKCNPADRADITNVLSMSMIQYHSTERVDTSNKSSDSMKRRPAGGSKPLNFTPLKNARPADGSSSSTIALSEGGFTLCFFLLFFMTVFISRSFVLAFIAMGLIYFRQQ